MPIASASKIDQISQAADPKSAIIKAVGDLTTTKIAADLVLLGTYIRNEKTAGGIIRPTDVLKEDEYQGKVGLVLAVGPIAYADFETQATVPQGEMAELHTWVVYQIKDAWPVQINGTACRVIPYDKIRMQIPEPSMVF
jgi:co-chaperonin GroES (HSP10)